MFVKNGFILLKWIKRKPKNKPSAIQKCLLALAVICLAIVLNVELFGSGCERSRKMSKITTKQIGEVIIQSEGEKPRITRENLQAFIRNPDAFGQVEFYPVSVGCGMTFDDLVSAGHYYSAGDENIKSDFQIESTGACVVDCELVRLNCDEVNFEDMLAHLKIIGMRPTTIEEFLTFGCKYPDVQREFPVVCLSPWTDLDGNRCALCLTTSHKQRILGFTPLESNWLGHTRFLAVSR